MSFLGCGNGCNPCVNNQGGEEGNDIWLEIGIQDQYANSDVQFGKSKKKNYNNTLKNSSDNSCASNSSQGVNTGSSASASTNMASSEAMLIDGKSMAQIVRAEIKDEITKLGIKPGLAVVLVGNRPDSATYVRNKTRAAIECGFKIEDLTFSESATEQEVLDCVLKLNKDETINGILVQLPLPKHMNEKRILEAIDVRKDADGFSAYNLGSLALKGGDPCAISCTPKGVMEMLKRSGVEIRGKKCVVLGRSNIVGTPLALLLSKADGTVTICHSRTENLKKECLQADILCAALGKAEFVKGDWIKLGAVVIDVGINSVDDPSTKKGYRLVGDVEFKEAKIRASKMTPVPGGVGPMTIAMLLQNTLELCKRKNGLLL